MNKISTVLCAAVLLALSSACLQLPLEYMPNERLKAAAPGSKIREVTYSVEQVIDGPFGWADGIATQKVLIGYIGNQLRKCRAFSKVTYKPFSSKSKYHIHFTAHYSAMPRDDVRLRQALMLCSFFIIPVRFASSLDMTAIVYWQDKAFYSPVATTGLQNYVWLGFLPVGMVWNNWWAWTQEEKKCSRLLVNRILRIR